jgi:Dehydrogenases with different specificities (related to short-chain alcohol dehydrogenases)
MLTRILDEAMDWTILPGYTSFGYRVRERLGPWDAIELGGRSVMVTGASAGIGEAACAELARAGATVHMVVRSRERGEQARKRIAATSGSTAVELHLCDLSSLASVREFASGFLASGGTLGVLINNAGVFPVERRHTEEGFELTFATNVLGPFLLTSLLLPPLIRAAPSRVINVSSGGMYTARIDVEDLQLEHRDFDGARFYAHAKRAEVILSEEWGRRLAADGITVHSTHPGWVATAGIESSLPRFNRLMGPLLRDPRAGSDTVVWLAGSPQAARSTGEFWHDRRRRPKHRVPWTRESPEERVRLFEACERLCGLSPGAATASAGEIDDEGD